MKVIITISLKDYVALFKINTNCCGLRFCVRTKLVHTWGVLRADSSIISQNKLVLHGLDSLCLFKDYLSLSMSQISFSGDFSADVQGN